MLASQPLQRLADRRAADAEALRQDGLADHRSRKQLQSDDLLLERAIGAVGQAVGAVGTGRFLLLALGHTQLDSRRAASISSPVRRQALSSAATTWRMKRSVAAIAC